MRLLPAGAWLRLAVGDRTEPKPVHYWDFAFDEDHSWPNRGRIVEELDRLFCRR